MMWASSMLVVNNELELRPMQYFLRPVHFSALEVPEKQLMGKTKKKERGQKLQRTQAQNYHQ
jgi:hypothetical protein